MLFALDVLLCLEAIVLWAQVEGMAPGVGWAALAACVGIDVVLNIPTRPMTDEERREWLDG